MKTLTESLKLIQEHIDLQMYGHAWDKCQELIDAVNARDSEPEAFHPPASADDMKVYQSIIDNYNKASNQSAYIKRLEDAVLSLLNCLSIEHAYYEVEKTSEARKLAFDALALKPKESIDG